MGKPSLWPDKPISALVFRICPIYQLKFSSLPEKLTDTSQIFKCDKLCRSAEDGKLATQCLVICWVSSDVLLSK